MSELDCPSDIPGKPHEILLWKRRLWDIENLGWVFISCITDTVKALKTLFYGPQSLCLGDAESLERVKNIDLCGSLIHSYVTWANYFTPLGFTFLIHTMEIIIALISFYYYKD